MLSENKKVKGVALNTKRENTFFLDKSYTKVRWMVSGNSTAVGVIVMHGRVNLVVIGYQVCWSRSRTRNLDNRMEWICTLLGQKQCR